MERYLKLLLPEIVKAPLRRLMLRKCFSEGYLTWAEARRCATGYDAPLIPKKILEAVKAVRDGEAAYERDGVLFLEARPDISVLRALLLIQSKLGRPLQVLDFGGSLGTYYWRLRTWLSQPMVWDIVEQKSFVSCGREFLADTPLRFFEGIDAATSAQNYDVVLCSTSLQYVEAPYEIIRQCADSKIRYLLINNLPLVSSCSDQVMLQTVPKSIYQGSYPVWFFSRQCMFGALSRYYDIIDEYASEVIWPVGWRNLHLTGIFLERKDHAHC